MFRRRSPGHPLLRISLRSWTFTVPDTRNTKTGKSGTQPTKEPASSEADSNRTKELSANAGSPNSGPAPRKAKPSRVKIAFTPELPRTASSFVERLRTILFHMPDLSNLVTISTGSKFMKRMKANKELRMIQQLSPRVKIEEMQETRKQGKDRKVAKIMKGKKIFRSDGTTITSSWPLVPFSYKTEWLMSSIGLDHLSKKLVAHDPWNFLAASQ
ncbi:hypothetical protein DXG01_016515 [Tephrocybe rancida]|nr:hypothetical protein DXG01_016515 [Tephrocybe rancida]